jgi:Zn-dependent protease
MSDFDVSAFLLWYVAMLIAMVFHEAAHAWVAYLGGDRTAYEAGQVTVNPVPHMRREPFGTIVLPILSFALWQFPIGFAHAPYNPYWADAHPRRAAAMSFAGPAANLLLAAAMFLVLTLGRSAGWFEVPLAQPGGRAILETLLVGRDSGTVEPWGAIAKIASVLLSMNLILGIFNLLPIPPLDGAGIAEGLLPRPIANFYRLLRANPTFAILGIVAAWHFASQIIWPVVAWTISALRA